VHQLLDDKLIEYALKNRELEEDTTVSTGKIVLGALACILALISHFYPTPFPGNVWLLKLCVASYFLINCVLQAVGFLEGHTILATRDALRGKKFRRGIKIQTFFPKYSEIFTIQLQPRKGKPATYSVEASIGRWFREDGTFLPELWAQDLNQLFQAVEASD